MPLSRIGFFLALTFLTFPSFGQRSGLFEAVYVYNFAAYVTWPSTNNDKEFVIGVLGKSSIVPQLEKTASIKKIRNKPIRVVVFNSIEEIEKCHLLYLPQEKGDDLDQVLKKIEGSSILLVSSGDYCQQGSFISIVDKSKKFEINLVNIQAAGMKVSSELLELALICGRAS